MMENVRIEMERLLLSVQSVIHLKATPRESCENNPRRYHTPMFKVTKSMFSQGSITCKNMCHHIQ